MHENTCVLGSWKTSYDTSWSRHSSICKGRSPYSRHYFKFLQPQLAVPSPQGLSSRSSAILRHSFWASWRLVEGLRHLPASQQACKCIAFAATTIKEDEKSFTSPQNNDIFTQKWRKVIAAEACLAPDNVQQSGQHSELNDELHRLNVNRGMAEQKLRHVFRNKSLIHGVLIHRSSTLSGLLVSQKALPMLAWLGDSLLFIFFTEDLLKRYPHAGVDAWSQARRILCDRSSLARALEALNLHQLLLTAPWAEKTTTWTRAYGEMCEAYLGAIYLDAGLSRAENFYRRLMKMPATLKEILQPGFDLSHSKRQRKPVPLRETMRDTFCKALQWKEIQNWSQSINIEAFQRDVRYQFEDQRYLLYVLIHGSLKVQIGDNPKFAQTFDEVIEAAEKLLFLGDAVIIHAITEYVAGTSQGASMGDMNAHRMKLNTRQDTVSRVAQKMGLHKFAIVHSIPQDVLSNSYKLLSDMLCRLIGVVYLERGLKSACQYIIEPIAMEFGSK